MGDYCNGSKYRDNLSLSIDFCTFLMGDANMHLSKILICPDNRVICMMGLLLLGAWLKCSFLSSGN